MKSGQGCYPSCVPRPAVGGIAGGRARPEKNRAPGRADGEMRGAVRRGNNLHLSVFSPSFHAFPLVPSGRGKGACYGGVAPLRGPFPPPESPPVPRAEALCSLPACSNQSFAFGTGGRTHPSPYAGRHEVRTRELPFRAYPVPPSEGLPGCGHDLRTPKPLAGPYGGKGVSMTWGLGVTLHAIPCRQVRVFRKRSFCWNTRTPG